MICCFSTVLWNPLIILSNEGTVHALPVKLNTVPLWSINDLFTCQKNNDNPSELQVWLRAELWEMLLP